MMASGKLFISVLVGALLASTMLGVSLNLKSAYAQDDRLWWVGEGAKQDLWLKYSIEEFDTNNAQPFEMLIIFKEQQDGDWLAPTYVVDKGNVINATLKLGSNLSPISGGTNIPPEMNDYISGYKRSLQWLESFTPQSKPQSLDAASWGRIACIGCEEIKPLRQETITVPGGTFETTVVGWHKSTDNDIWISNGFPYPIKAQTFVDVTTGQAPTLFKFELLATGVGQPEIPAGTGGEIPEPPLQRDTGRGTYTVRLEWDPIEIRPGATIAFGVVLTEKSGFPLERVNYDFTIVDGSGNMLDEFKNQNSDFGTGTHEVNFESAGPMTVTVTINSISGVPAGGGTFTEEAKFNIVVVPEFPVSAALMVAVVIGFVVILTRLKTSGLRGLFDRSNVL